MYWNEFTTLEEAKRARAALYKRYRIIEGDVEISHNSPYTFLLHNTPPRYWSVIETFVEGFKAGRE